MARLSPKVIAKILTKENLINAYENLKSVDRVAQQYSVSGATVRKYMKLYDIPVKHFCKYSFINIFLKDTEASFYIAGFIAADGNLYKRKTDEHYGTKIQLAVKDKNHLIKIKKLLYSDHPIYHEIAKTGIESCRIYVTSKELFETLHKFNITLRKTKTYKFPTHLKKSSINSSFYAWIS